MSERVKVFFFSLFCLAVFTLTLISIDNGKTNVTAVNTTNDNELTVIIDAGHGGSDGGAVASDGTEEADINLKIAEKLNEYLTLMGYKTVMTRSNSESIGEQGGSIKNEKVSDIHKRLDIMNSVDKCLFISIHQNFYSGSSSWGTQVFYSPNKPESQRLADSIQKSVVGYLQPDNKRAIKPTGKNIYLMYHAQKPAVLVECGFLSNENELKNLKDKTYQSKIAFGIMLGIIDYLTEG